MKLRNRIIAILFTVVMALSTLSLVTINVSAVEPVYNVLQGEEIIIEHIYGTTSEGYNKIVGKFTLTDLGLFSEKKVTVILKTESKDGKINEFKYLENYDQENLSFTCEGLGKGQIIVQLKLKLSNNAKVGASSDVKLTYQLDENGASQTENISKVTVKPKLDYSVLIGLINKANALNPLEYTAKTWSTLEAALNSAILAQNAQTQTAVDNAANALDIAIKKLEKIPTTPEIDLDELLKQIKIAENLTENDYTTSSWSALKKALNTAKSAKTSTSQSTIDSAAKGLKNAIAKLENAKVDVSVDYKELNRQIAIAEGLKQKNYTIDSWKTLNSAYISAISARGSDNQNTVDKAATALSKAITNLVPAQNIIDYIELDKQLAIAKGLDSKKYTNISYAELQKAIKAGEAALNSTVQEEVNVATENIRTAIANLIELQVNELLTVIQSIKDHITNENLAKLWKELFEVYSGYQTALDSGDQEKIDSCALQLKTYLDTITKEIETLKKAQIVEIEKVVEVEPTDDYCNIPSHRLMIALFWVSIALNVALVGLIVYYIIKKSKTGDNTPIVDYDITDDTDIDDIVE